MEGRASKKANDIRDEIIANKLVLWDGYTQLKPSTLLLLQTITYDLMSQYLQCEPNMHPFAGQG